MPKKHKRTALEKLQKHWQRANDEERRAFLAHVHTNGVDPQAAPMADTFSDMPHVGIPTGSGAMIANGRYLLPLTVARIEKIMITRHIGPSEVMAEMGFAGHGTALTRALIRKASIRLIVISALQRWLHVNEAGDLAEQSDSAVDAP